MKTDLSKILTASGQRGLFEYIASARNGIIVESLEDKRRLCLDVRTKINSLYDISIYTDEEEIRLQSVFRKMTDILADKDAPTSKSSAEELKSFFEQVIPNYDRDRFYVSHMKKVVEWYNILKKYASLDFEEPKEAEESDNNQ